VVGFAVSGVVVDVGLIDERWVTAAPDAGSGTPGAVLGL